MYVSKSVFRCLKLLKYPNKAPRGPPSANPKPAPIHFPYFAMTIYCIFKFNLFKTSRTCCTILFEAGLTRHFDFIICVTASEATRLKRVILRDAVFLNSTYSKHPGLAVRPYGPRRCK